MQTQTNDNVHCTFFLFFGQWGLTFNPFGLLKTRSREVSAGIPTKNKGNISKSLFHITFVPCAGP